jgi:hypothetical protein
MGKPTIDYAINTLNSLSGALEKAYWDSSDIVCKDRVFDLYAIVNAELTELAKLSVNDLDLPFEAMTPNFSSACAKLGLLKQNIDSWFHRSSTAEELARSIPLVAELISDQCKI